MTHNSLSGLWFSHREALLFCFFFLSFPFSVERGLGSLFLCAEIKGSIVSLRCILILTLDTFYFSKNRRKRCRQADRQAGSQAVQLCPFCNKSQSVYFSFGR